MLTPRFYKEISIVCNDLDFTKKKLKVFDIDNIQGY